MRGLTASDVLDICDRGRDLGDAERAMLMLATAGASTPAELRDISLGTRNRLLLRLHVQSFGTWIEGLVACLRCAETLAVSFRVDGRDGDEEPVVAGWQTAEVGGREVRYRLPTAGDLVAIEGLGDLAEAHRVLIARCIEVPGGARSRAPRRLPAAVVRDIAARMAEADPDALVDLEVACPVCGDRQPIAFDIAAYLWGEIETLGARLVREVHALASALGWGEGEILSLPARRRAAYLELVGA